MGFEGFIESIMPEVAPFGIEATIFEPGTIRTDFGATAVLSPAIAAYDASPARMIRNACESLQGGATGLSRSKGDPAKMAQVIIDSAAQSPAPKRVAMGSDAYQGLGAVYRERAAALEAQQELALSTDYQP